MAKRKKKTERQKLIDKLDAVMREAIKVRDDYTCQKCGAKATISYRKGKPGYYGCHWAHIYSRNSHKLRWDWLNSLVLCAGCHRFYHDNPLDGEWWFRVHFAARYDYLEKRRQEPTKHIPQTVLQEWLDERKTKLHELKHPESEV